MRPGTFAQLAAPKAQLAAELKDRILPLATIRKTLGYDLVGYANQIPLFAHLLSGLPLFCLIEHTVITWHD